MNLRTQRENVERAAEDLRRRTLSEIPRSLDRLIYLASMRDYNTGLYYHDGLAGRFTQDAACEALADCHREAFRDLLRTPLRELVAQMEAYVQATGTSPFDFVTAWKKLEPYRVAVPVQTDSLSSEFLFSNFKVALAILEARLRPVRAAASA
jgi:hypothetical protein